MRQYNVGDRISATVVMTVERSRDVRDFWGRPDTEWFRIFKTDDGETFKYISRSCMVKGGWTDEETGRREPLIVARQGCKLQIRGTVKGISEYKGETQYELQRITWKMVEDAPIRMKRTAKKAEKPVEEKKDGRPNDMAGDHYTIFVFKTDGRELEQKARTEENARKLLKKKHPEIESWELINQYPASYWQRRAAEA